MGERIFAALTWEWDQRAVEPASWRAVLEDHSPHVLLLEVAHGIVPGWGSSGTAELAALCQHARRSGAPVVIWVTRGSDPKEDAPLAVLADVVFLAQEANLAEWRVRMPGSRIEVLAPAAQPRVHGPQSGSSGVAKDRGACLILDEDGWQTVSVELLSTLVAPAVKPLAPSDFHVWPVRSDRPGPPLPAELQRRVDDPRPYAEVAHELGRHAVLVDAGRGDRPSTWQALDAGAARTAVVTLPEYAATLPPKVAASVAVAAEPQSLRSEIMARMHQPELRDREGVALRRAVLSAHTYSHRVDSILQCIGRAESMTNPLPVSTVVSTNREHEIGNVLANVARQAYPDVELVLVLHGLHIDINEVSGMARQAGIENLTLREADASLTLGSCLNLGIEAAAGSYIAKMDDDNFYGRHYLTDLVGAFSFTDAGIVGKWAHYVWLRSSGAVVLRYPAAEETYERRVQGGTMLLDGEVARKLRFSDLPRSVDSDLLDRASAEGISIYSADRFNFVSVRNADRDTHTWKVADSTFMTQTGRLVFYGDPRVHVQV